MARWSERNAVPAPLAVTFDFLNTLDERTFGAHRPVDEIAGPAELAAWLSRYGLVPAGTGCSAAQHRDALRLRAALRSAAAGVGEGRVDLPLRAEVGSGGVLTLRGAGDGVSGALGTLLAAAVAGSADGSWQRVKMCAAADCKVLFYDHTKPRNGRWCSATGCGNRSKTRSYRSRRVT